MSGTRKSARRNPALARAIGINEDIKDIAATAFQVGLMMLNAMLLSRHATEGPSAPPSARSRTRSAA